LSDLLTGLFQPFPFLFLLMGLGITNLWRCRREPCRRLLPITVSFGALTLLSMPAVSYLSLGTLEWRYPPIEHRPGDAQAIVVLGGGLFHVGATLVDVEMNSATLSRCMHAAAVYHGGKPCPVVVCGGKRDNKSTEPPLALVMREFLLDKGVADNDIIMEDRSQSTHENAVECRKLLDQRRIGKVILVTDAIHMLRALRSFEKQGIDVVPSACAHRAIQFGWSALGFLPSCFAFERHERVIHEWIGFAWYWFSGYL
jgi:uncharacterized SAM-binding protein YcdF (DUF218 family)